MPKKYLDLLAQEYQRAANPVIAQQQSDYMRGQFAYYGIKSPERRLIEKPFLVKSYLPPIEKLEAYMKEIWNRDQRDFQMFGLDFCKKYMKRFREEDIQLLEYLVIHKSWWDTVDNIAYKLMGQYFQLYPHQINPYVDKWLSSENMWLQRSALLFQLKYKGGLDTILLTKSIEHLIGSKQFFINKAIGWVLREYSRTDAEWVLDFVEDHPGLSALSKREALRLVK